MLSVFEIYSIGIGPSSSHTVGPMRAAKKFTELLKSKNVMDEVSRVHIELYGSLALTGVGHGTDKAIILGLLGEEPESIDVDTIEGKREKIEKSKEILLLGEKRIPFVRESDILFHKNQSLPDHPNGMSFQAIDREGHEILKKSISQWRWLYRW